MKKSNIILFGLITFALLSMAIISASVTIAKECYQEFANVSTACGGLNTGVYILSGTCNPSYPCPNSIDGDWATASATNSQFTLWINYTVPIGALNLSLWQSLLFIGSNPIINYTIPTPCWNTNKLQFRIESNDVGTTYVNATCFTGTQWYQLFYETGVSNQIYEEAMIWNITTSSVTLNSPNSNDFSDNLVTFNCSAGSNETLTNLSLYSNYTGSWTLINTTNISGTSNITTFSNTLPDGRFGWTCRVCDSSGCGYANNRTINVNVMPDDTLFGFCNSTLAVKFLNITFKDESTSSRINASIPSSTFVYYRGSPIINRTFSFINNSENYEYDFCASPNITLSIIPNLQYKQGTAYPQRVWNPSVIDYTNSTTSQILYLLGSADGIYVTFQVVNSADQVLSGVDVTTVRNIGGTDTVVGTGATGASGTVTFWMNPDFSHTFTFSKSGYTTYTYSDTPTQTSYTITLAGGSSSVTNNTFRGINYAILPINLTLINNTDYTFGFQVNSSYWDVSEYGFNLRFSNGTIVSGGSTGIEGTYLTFIHNTGNQSVIYIDYYWVIEGDYTNATRYWAIYNTANTQWSIKYFFTDLTTYLDSGLFGIDNFGRYFIIFIIIFTMIGVMSMKFGITSPLTITTMIFGVIFFFDVIVGLIPAVRGINHLLTYISALILTISIFMEVQR
jgi:hypothetical protein